MVIETKTHEDIMKFIILLDKWRKHIPREEEMVALSTVGTRRFPKEVKNSIRIARSLESPQNFPFFDKIISPAQTLAAALLVIFVFVLLSSFWNIFSWADDLLSNPLFVYTILIPVLISGFVMYQHRQKTQEYLEVNKIKLEDLRKIADELLTQLTPLAINREFNPKKFPFQLNHDDYQGLRLMGRRSNLFHLIFSTPHSLMSSSRDVKIMTSIGRLGFFDGLRGFKGGKPAIKIVASKIAGDFKSYLKKCADWRHAGVDVIVRKATEDLIKRTTLIIDDQEVWVTDLLLEEIDITDPLKITKITSINEKKKILEEFETVWNNSQIAEELEALSWRTYYKEKAETERKKRKEEKDRKK